MVERLTIERLQKARLNLNFKSALHIECAKINENCQLKAIESRSLQ